MNISLNHLSFNGIDIKKEYVFSEEYYKDSFIKDIDPFLIDIHVKINNIDELVITGHIKGNIYLDDAYTGDKIPYLIDKDIKEEVSLDEINTKKRQETLDLSVILWENIVLEVPIRISNSNKPTETKGDGWELKEEL